MNVDIDTINLVWTFGFVGFIIGSLISGFIFRRFCKAKGSKMWFLASSFFINGTLLIFIEMYNIFPFVMEKNSRGVFLLSF